MKNKEVVILTDSSCDLPQSFLDEKGIKFISFNITLGDKTYLDRIDLNTEKMIDIIEETGEISKTGAVSPENFIQFFSQYQDSEIVYIGLGSGFSSSYNNACYASKEFDNVYIVDSKNLSCGTGLLLNKACIFRDQGYNAKEIKEKIEELVPKVRVQFVINTLKYLHKGGRCSGTARILGVALNLKPIIRVQNNKMVVSKKPIGYTRGLHTLYSYYEADKNNIDNDLVTVTHCIAKKECDKLINKIKEDNKSINVIETSSGCVISSHCGPRCIGILYILKNDMNESLSE